MSFKTYISGDSLIEHILINKNTERNSASVPIRGLFNLTINSNYGANGFKVENTFPSPSEDYLI